ncbi:MAG: hypothetical protein ACLVH8_07025 [Fusobacterium sp.]|uniref:hypothetical protein n=1 Tax=Fusobacterium sp. SB021 TaxID=2744227 RepID=UPI001D914803|nr:hypothetical protein [Fusobacterium sp.]
MGIEKNLKYMLEEYEAETLKLERLNNFIKSEEFKTSTDCNQKVIIIEKLGLLKSYIAKLKEQIDYDKKILDERDVCVSPDGNYDNIGKCCKR